MSVSWYCLLVVDLDILLAPVLKFWFFLKSTLFKTLPALAIWLWVSTVTKIVGWLGELLAVLGTMLGGWKAWSTKKLARQAGHFLLSLSARFVAVNVLLNLLFGHERRGIKSLPRFALYRLQSTWFGRVMQFWKHASDRQKRLLLGVVLCLILIAAGQVMLGVSVLLFDLAWELVLFLWRLFLHLWRFISPLLLKLLPNFIGKFLTGKLLPLLADIVPVIKDDQRVMYLRFNFRHHMRRFKAWLYMNSRARRNAVRSRITPLVGTSLRYKKTALLKAAGELHNSKSNEGESP